MSKIVSSLMFVIGIFLFISGANALGYYLNDELDSVLVGLFPMALSSFFFFIGKEIRKEESR